MDILFQGSESIPTSFGGLSIVTPNQTEAQIKAAYDTGRSDNANFTIVIQDGGSRFAYTPPPVIAPTDAVLPKLDFLRHAATQLGSGGRVVEIEEAFAGHASADIRYAHKEYAATNNFTKDKVKDFLNAGIVASILTAEERDAVIDNWPT